MSWPSSLSSVSTAKISGFVGSAMGGFGGEWSEEMGDGMGSG